MSDRMSADELLGRIHLGRPRPRLGFLEALSHSCLACEPLPNQHPGRPHGEPENASDEPKESA